MKITMLAKKNCRYFARIKIGEDSPGNVRHALKKLNRILLDFNIKHDRDDYRITAKKIKAKLFF